MLTYHAAKTDGTRKTRDTRSASPPAADGVSVATRAMKWPATYTQLVPT